MKQLLSGTPTYAVLVFYLILVLLALRLPDPWNHIMLMVLIIPAATVCLIVLLRDGRSQ